MSFEQIDWQLLDFRQFRVKLNPLHFEFKKYQGQETPISCLPKAGKRELNYSLFSWKFRWKKWYHFDYYFLEQNICKRFSLSETIIFRFRRIEGRISLIPVGWLSVQGSFRWRRRSCQLVLSSFFPSFYLLSFLISFFLSSFVRSLFLSSIFLSLFLSFLFSKWKGQGQKSCKKKVFLLHFTHLKMRQCLCLLAYETHFFTFSFFDAKNVSRMKRSVKL